MISRFLFPIHQNSKKMSHESTFLIEMVACKYRSSEVEIFLELLLLTLRSVPVGRIQEQVGIEMVFG